NGRAVLAEPLPAESSSFVEQFAGVSAGLGAEFEGFALLGNAEDEQEIVYFSDIDSNFVWTVSRGMLDTTPKEWPAGTEIMFFSPVTMMGDTTNRSPGEVVKYKLLPRTSRGILPLDDAPEMSFTISNR